MSEVKQSNRIQESILSSWEKKTLVSLAKAQPDWVTSNILTGVGILGSILIFLGYCLSSLHPAWLWLSSFGFVVNWYGDSLDGTLARVRNTQRPLFGYYLDHTVDVINEALIFIGAGLSPYLDMTVAVASLILYYAMTINVSMNAHLRSEFKLSYAGLGPTEFRVIIIIINTLLYCFHSHIVGNNVVTGITYIIPLALLAVYLVTIIKDAGYYSKIDPPRKYEKGSK